MIALLLLAATAESPVTKNEPAIVFGRVSTAVVVVNATLSGGKSQGSGVVVAKGTAATNFHVVKGATAITVTQGGLTVPAKLLKFDEKRDVALLTFEGLDRRPVKLASAKTVSVGDHVYAIGAPHGLDLTLSDGLVSSLREEPKGSAPTLQTTAPISPGSSGGGLFDARGRLVGITTKQHASGQNLNFAHPSDWVSDLLAGKDAKGEPSEKVSEFTVTARPKNVACSFEDRSVWGLFADGPELLESQPYSGELAFWGFDGQTPLRGLNDASAGRRVAGGDEQLVLRDMSRKKQFLAFEGGTPANQYFFVFDDDGAIRLIKAEVVSFHGQPRLVTRSGPCTADMKKVATRPGSMPSATDEEACLGGSAKMCLQLARSVEGGQALVYFRRACEAGDSEGCNEAARLYEGVDDKEKAAKFRQSARTLGPAQASEKPAEPVKPTSERTGNRRPLSAQ